ncbi:MAG TPA: BON domain-containing protein [Longimicrobiales bacterium]
MARYGREYERGARRGGRRMYGPAYDWEYGRVHGYGAEPGYGDEYYYGEEFIYDEEMGYGEEAGYGAGMGYGREPLGYPGAYDYEYGGRGWPYREGRRRWPRRATRYRGPRGRYGWELYRPARYGYGYGYAETSEYYPSGAPAYRRARGGVGGGVAPWRRRRPGWWRRGAYVGYEGEFAGSRYGGRGVARGYGRGYERAARQRADYDIEMTSRAGMLSGHSAPDRWPDVGHDVDARPARERDMSDDEIREAVLENLFQDTWVDPDRIDVEVDHGVVTLRGEVRDFMEARYAWDDAWESAGVRGVVNNLTVRTDRPQEEMELPQTAGARKPAVEARG